MCIRDSLYTDQGAVFYPHDFYQPLANLFMAWKERDVMGRRALSGGRQRGEHGHLPGHPAEEGFLLLADTHARPASERITLMDFAPTVLALTGREAPPHMKGSPAFTTPTSPERSLATAGTRCA